MEGQDSRDQRMNDMIKNAIKQERSDTRKLKIEEAQRRTKE